uniref:PLAT domain-containing protein n=1 Tax=Caenorhabditis japonica TaxID=281687 RepID=A0A8R1HLC8_CAEJA
MDQKDDMIKIRTLYASTAFHLPLGELEYLRMWIDDAGLEHRESWYCNRVIVKDLQTQQIYYFPFYNWLGTKNGDGETERLSRVDYKRRILDESMSMHMLGQTMTWFGMFTGGGNRLRDRVTRMDYIASLIFALVFVNIINVIVLKNDDSIIKSSVSFSEFTFTVKDVILGAVYALVLTIIASLHILICCKCRSFSEQYYYKKRKQEEPEFKDPSASWSHTIAGLTRAFLPFPTMMGMIYIAADGMSLMDDSANSFYIRFLISTILWAAVLEPLKGMIWAFVLLKTSKSHKISNKLEEAFLKVKPVETFKRNPYGKIEKDLGTEIADISKLRDTDSRKMRDEQLFVTLRDMLCFFASLYIMLMLTYYCKDRNAFFYQQEGQEFDVVIVLTTRTRSFRNSPFFEADHRLNVALSRTRHLCLLMVNRSAAWESRLWSDLMQRVDPAARHHQDEVLQRLGL